MLKSADSLPRSSCHPLVVATVESRAQCCLVALCGLPGSGKSSLCERICAYAHDCVPGVACHHHRFDAFQPADAVQCEQHVEPAGGGAHAWGEARARALTALDVLLCSACSSAQPLTLLLADDVAHMSSMRADLSRLARRRGASYAQLFVDTPFEVCAARNAARVGAARVPEAVLLRLSATLERPEASPRGFERVTLVTHGGEAASEVWSRLWCAWGAPPAPPVQPAALAARRALGQAANQGSWAHGWDLRARRAVADAVNRGALRRPCVSPFTRRCVHCVAAPPLTTPRRQLPRPLECRWRSSALRCARGGWPPFVTRRSDKLQTRWARPCCRSCGPSPQPPVRVVKQDACCALLNVSCCLTALPRVHMQHQQSKGHLPPFADGGGACPCV